ncbi:hypothetical protein AURDEDRAFT_140101 [Auricularia subglabra TFB-10046 SS5]|uniref:Acyl-CoA desaturase n=1 Tax=Auricularia subglabra (strain TFB-10046 / SS5) TaxID=717982 RepID=J0LFS0_AURST|nr:hypothetical protein AURDEDRAFT_140101 [Auricularia subglabra TFB-10046 SS5]
MDAPTPRNPGVSGGQFWASNAIFFAATHLLAVIGLWIHPPARLPRATLWLMPILWHFAMFGVLKATRITVGYHRLWSHRSFRAGKLVRTCLALGGASAVQGLRHRLHHRFTDDPVHDPYSATRGMLFAHMGWIFFKPAYPRLNLIGRDDLERDAVVRLQHKYYVPIAIFMGFVLPVLLGALWNDALGGFLYGALWNRVLIWHCTFLVNSLAHWHGLQPYSDEVTARGNLLIAMLTNGEGNHNFHAFPHDFRAGLRSSEYDPSKWLLLVLHRFKLVWGLRRARREDIAWAVEDMRRRHNECGEAQEDAQSVIDNETPPTWSLADVQGFVKTGRCALLIDNFVVDATSILGEHPGGSALLRRYSMRTSDIPVTTPETGGWPEGHWAFHGGLNNHSRAARKRMRELRVARLAAEDSQAH